MISHQMYYRHRNGDALLQQVVVFMAAPASDGVPSGEDALAGYGSLVQFVPELQGCWISSNTYYGKCLAL